MNIILHSGRDGRVYWINEEHQDTDEQHCVCRAVEGQHLTHVVVKTRSDLKPYLVTEMNGDIINLGCYPDRLNAGGDVANTQA